MLNTFQQLLKAKRVVLSDINKLGTSDEYESERVILGVIRDSLEDKIALLKDIV